MDFVSQQERGREVCLGGGGGSGGREGKEKGRGRIVQILVLGRYFKRQNLVVQVRSDWILSGL